MNRWKNVTPAIAQATAEEFEYYRETGQYSVVVEICVPIAINSPDDFLAQYNLAIAYMDTDFYPQAVEAYDIVLQLPLPDDLGLTYSEILLYKGQALHADYKFEEALDTLLKVDERELDANKIGQLYNHISDSYTNLKKHEQALDTVEKAIESCPETPDYYNQKGNILCELDRHQESLACYERAIEIDPNVGLYYLNRGKSYTDLDDEETALLDYEEAILLDPTSEAYWSKGKSLDALERYEECVEALDIAIQMDPLYADAYSLKGDVLHSLGRYEEAHKYMDRAIEMNPNVFTYWNNKGYSYNHVGRYDDAIKCFDRAIECDDAVENAYCHKGYSYFKLGDLELAMQLYNKALDIAPAYELALERVNELRKHLAQ